MITCADAIKKIPAGPNKLFLSAFASDSYGESARYEPFDQLLVDLLCNIRHLENAEAEQLDWADLVTEAAHTDSICETDPGANQLRAGSVVLAMAAARIPLSSSSITTAKAAISDACATFGISEEDVKRRADDHYREEVRTGTQTA